MHPTTILRIRARTAATVLLALLPATAALAAGDLPTRFSNRDGIVNTRHNLTQRTSTFDAGDVMNPSRNNYGEVCVYCHTPHGGNTTLDAPLWNRTYDTSVSYTTYDQLGTPTLTQPVTAPGVNSLTCLSCHDGTLAIDSIINMPGSGNYQQTQQSSQDNVFLSTWVNSGSATGTHAALNSAGCLACHAPDAPPVIGASATDLTITFLGTDLRNDHPIGVTLPTGAGVDFNPTTGASPGLAFFDGDGDQRADSDEIRLYDRGDGFEVECASCHDPHGVPSNGAGSEHYPTFLRVSNDGSGVCITCHAK